MDGEWRMANQNSSKFFRSVITNLQKSFYWLILAYFGLYWCCHVTWSICIDHEVSPIYIWTSFHQFYMLLYYFLIRISSLTSLLVAAVVVSENFVFARYFKPITTWTSNSLKSRSGRSALRLRGGAADKGSKGLIICAIWLSIYLPVLFFSVIIFIFNVCFIFFFFSSLCGCRWY